MNIFRQRSTGDLVNETVIRDSFDGSLPPVLGPAILDTLGYDPVLESPMPDVPFGKMALQDGVEQHPDGNWFYKYTVVDLPPEILIPTRINAQTAAWRNIQAIRDERYYGGVKQIIENKIYWFHNDLETRSRYSLFDTLVRRNSLPDTYVLHPGWKTMTGEFVPLTVEILYNIISDGVVQEGAVFEAGELHKVTMQDAEDPTRYNANVGWPESYQDYAAALIVEVPK